MLKSSSGQRSKPEKESISFDRQLFELDSSKVIDGMERTKLISAVNGIKDLQKVM